MLFTGLLLEFRVNSLLSFLVIGSIEVIAYCVGILQPLSLQFTRF